MLEPHGVTIMEAAKAYLAQLGEGASPETFRERYTRAVLDGEGHWSAIYVRDMGKLENWTGKSFMETKCALIKPQTIADALRKHGAKAQSTLEHRIRYVNSILNFKPRHRKETKIAILSVGQSATFIRAGGTREERWAAAVLLFTFYANGASFLAYAVMAGKRGMDGDARGRKSLFFTTGLAEATETLLVFVAFCLWPHWFAAIAYAFAAITAYTCVSRIVLAWRTVG